MGPFGAMIEGRRKKPGVGNSNWFGMVPPRLVEVEVVLGWPVRVLAEFGLQLPNSVMIILFGYGVSKKGLCFIQIFSDGIFIYSQSTRK